MPVTIAPVEVKRRGRPSQENPYSVEDAKQVLKALKQSEPGSGIQFDEPFERENDARRAVKFLKDRMEEIDPNARIRGHAIKLGERQFAPAVSIPRS